MHTTVSLSYSELVHISEVQNRISLHKTFPRKVAVIVDAMVLVVATDAVVGVVVAVAIVLIAEAVEAVTA